MGDYGDNQPWLISMASQERTSLRCHPAEMPGRKVQVGLARARTPGGRSEVQGQQSLPRGRREHGHPLPRDLTKGVPAGAQGGTARSPEAHERRSDLSGNNARGRTRTETQ